MRISKTLGLTLLAVAACGASGAAFADNVLGFYVGAGAGESQIRSDDSRYGYPGYFNDYQTAWQAIVGIRPIKLIGIEAEYIDFGQPSRHHSYDYNVSGSDSHPRAPAVFAVGYLPIPIPYLDIFAKVGAARLSTNLTDFVQQACIPDQTPCPNFVPVSRHQVIDTRVAYGAGVQSKFPFGLIVRGEYERISSPYGDPSALMVSALWQF
jgi:Outer membrane protein beta-barrel domain